MFVTLLAVTFLISLIVTFVVARLFQGPIGAILERIFGDKISSAWQRYVTFAIYVVGISGGVRIWDLEKYISPHAPGQPELLLTRDRWVLEVYRTVIETLQSTAWLLLAFFLITLVAYMIIRIVEKATANAVPSSASSQTSSAEVETGNAGAPARR
ncbi:MAG TPA: hypothetical protein VN956_19350 [Pyrinomonadaceae bacterium]|nr:hypothetical protein [Pyrinomonadaceae bacterium]